nr:uncharacterized protein LOC109181161 [Ipomoea trifida]
MTWSRAASVPPKSEPPKSAPKSAPVTSSKKSKSRTFQPVLLHSAGYSVLLRLAATNWLPSVNANLMYEKMAFLLFKIRNKLDVDLGSVIFSHIMSFTKRKKEAKVYLPYPSLIYGVLSAQGFTPYDHEPILENEHFYQFDLRLAQGHHHDDRVHSIPLLQLRDRPLLRPQYLCLLQHWLWTGRWPAPLKLL